MPRKTAASLMFQAYQRVLADADVDEIDDVAEAQPVDEVADGATRSRPSPTVTSGPRPAPWRHSYQATPPTTKTVSTAMSGAEASRKPKMAPSL